MKEFINNIESFNMDDYSIFSVIFHTKKSKGRVFKDSFGRIIIAVNEFDFVLCDDTDFNEYVKISALEKGRRIIIDGVNAVIDSINTETVEEELKFWDYVESQDIIEYMKIDNL